MNLNKSTTWIPALVYNNEGSHSHCPMSPNTHINPTPSSQTPCHRLAVAPCMYALERASASSHRTQRRLTLCHKFARG